MNILMSRFEYSFFVDCLKVFGKEPFGLLLAFPVQETGGWFLFHVESAEYVVMPSDKYLKSTFTFLCDALVH